MEDKKSGNSVLPISSILVMMAVFGGIWLYKNPLMGTRPTTNTNITCEEKVPARLWQDPFVAVSKYKNGKETEIGFRSVSSAGIVSKISGRINKNVEVTVLGIMVFGAPYAEAAENRLRRRYAAVSALGRLRYVPEDSQHIEYFDSKMTGGEDSDSPNRNKSGNCTQSEHGNKLTIPFEWFSEEKKLGGSSKAVLLLWLNEDKFQSNPLLKLSNLISEIKKSVIKNGPSNTSNLEFKILGPAGSTNLVSMMKEVTKPDSEDKETEPVDYESFEIYSPFATADRTSLFEHGLGKKNKIENISKYLWDNSGKKIKLIRTIGSDKNLCEALNNELLLRRASPVNNNENHVALIAEWDTFYGRSLPQSFKDSANDLMNKDSGNVSTEVATRFHRFSYLRGIDGQLPGEDQTGPARLKLEKQTNSNREKSAADTMRRPVGRNQFDYLLRLTQQIQKLNHELRMNGEGSIKAIGVLGSDVYDKLLILQAMRQRFPEVVFFTTDLDARLLHPDEFKWTRNLIVASYFGFRLDRDIQGSIPPFRNNYQTSLFFSTLLALKSSSQIFSDSFPQQNSVNTFLQPQIFEIGRRGEFDLTKIKDEVIEKNQIISINLDNIEESMKIMPKTLYPQTNISKGKEYVGFIQHISLLVIGGMFALFALLYVSSDTTKKSVEFIRNPKNKFDYIMRWLILAFVVIVPTAFWCVLQKYGDRFYLEEPFSLFDGVSIWPTEILRSLSAALSILFIFLVWYKIRSTDRFITDNFGLPEEEKKSIKISKLAYVFPFFWNIDDKKEKDAAACFDMIWKEYLSLGPFWISAVRAVIYTVAFIVFMILFIAILDYFDFSLFVPARGEFSFLFDKIILFISVPSMLFLTFYIVGKHQLFRQFIRFSSKHEEKCMLKAGGCRREDAYRKISILAEYTEQIK
ncbi:MAG: hypothetical protein H8D23_19840, partial [Candidatus Brocadiales bacterium]|nr:hypothetical protein [Candidatus Brocadiales bacterium]